MARELDSEVLRRLQESYREMSDGQLLELAGTPEDLTDLAVEVLRGEMTHRGLKPAAVAEASEAGAYAVPQPEFGRKLPDGSVVLLTLYDATAVGNACACLEADGIEVNVRDVSEKDAMSGSFYGGPPVALEVIVPGADRARSVVILREKMGLFPLQEVEEADELVDDGTLAALGFFGKRSDADDVAHALDEAKIWNRVVANPEGTVEDENAYSLEVREIDLAEAGDVVEKSMGLAEG
jgi:hypothetical protein